MWPPVLRVQVVKAGDHTETLVTQDREATARGPLGREEREERGGEGGGEGGEG